MSDNMEKPTPVIRKPIFNYRDCVKFIEHKLGYEIRDTLGKFKQVPDGTGYTKLHVAHVEYRDWWHFLLDQISVNNPCEITIGDELLVGTDWQNEITQAFIDEFGNNTKYHVDW